MCLSFVSDLLFMAVRSINMGTAGTLKKNCKCVTSQEIELGSVGLLDRVIRLAAIA
jgi:hypothetical protein